MYSGLRVKAGSGKSTLIKFIIKALGVPNSQVAYVAYTGKAAAVLQAKGNPNATTVHKLIYHAYPTKTGKYKFRPRIALEKNYKILVVDEVSMLPKPMWDLLLSYKVYVLACGDPGQLPSLYKSERNDILDHPHVFLDEIMRQAQDSEIIRLSMHVREGKPISTFNCQNQQVQIIHRNEIISGMYTWADQIICATNKTRNFINKLVRDYKGLDSEKPCIGDRIIGLHNDWDTLSDNGEWALTNGTIGTILGYEVENQWITPRLKLPIKDIDIAYTDFELEDGSVFSGIPIDYQGLATGELVLDDLARYRMANWDQSNLFPPHDFVYAYAITCWKAQGSEYNNVMLIEEDHPYDKTEHMQYLYTGITRAKEKLIVVVKD